VTVDVVAHPEFYSTSMDITEGWSITQETDLAGITINSVTNKQLLDTSNYGTNISNWNTAFGWGDHSLAGYTGDQDLSGYLLNTTDTFAGNITFNGGNNNSKESFLNVKRGSGAGLWLKFQTDSTSANNVSQFVIRRSTDNVDILSISAASGNLSVPGTLSASGYNDGNWNTAYGWGDHSLAGYTGDQDLTGYATETYVGTQIDNLIASAPGTLDTLNELAAALGDDPNFATTITTSIATKLPLAGGVMSGNIGRSAHNKGYLVGGYNNIGASATATNPIFTIGTSYLPAVTTLGNMYGIGYTRGDASFMGIASGSGWGMYVAADGDARIWLDGSNGDIVASGTLSASGYNDGNWNTAYGWGDHASAGYQAGGNYLLDSTDTFTGSLSIDGDIRGTGQQLILNAGESYSVATAQTNEYVYVNAEQGLEVNSDTGNWSGGWAARKTALLRGDLLRIDGEDLTKTNVQNFKTAYGWGDHSGVYLPIGGKAADSDKLDGINSTSFLRSDAADEATQLTVNTLIIGSSAKIQFQNNDFIRYDDANGVGRFHFDSDGGTNNASVQASTFVGALSGNATTATTASNSNLLDNLDSTQFLRSDTADSFTGTITMGTQKALVANNYGRGVYGLYSASRYQHVWSMGTAYNLSDDGTTSGNLYGLAFTHTNVGGQSKSGLGHQLLIMDNGVTKSAIGNGIWTNGTITTTSHGTSADWKSAYTYSQVGHLTSSSTLNASNMTTGTLPDVFSPSTRYNIGLIDGYSSQTRDKLRVWDSGTYSIGMKDGYSYGHLGGGSTDYAMSFQMSNNNTRGFWWGDSTHTDAQGSMSLTTDGNLVVATSISIGQGETITAPSTTPLYVEGSTAGETVFEVQGTSGQLFSITDSLIGDIFEVSDISGVPIFTVNSSGIVTVDDTLHVTGDVIAYYASDRRLKDNIKPIENSIDKIKMIGGYEFDWNSKSKNNNGHDVGVIAQEIEEVLPELVGTRSDGFKGVKYEKLTALLIQANKELIERVEELESKLKK
ncbi:tail fiber domain-containing protein, partial [Flavobacteriaceae bacterium]|nr:tail fiber domain-containing protein [Flavobacteriaceae bacterium]